MDLKKLINSKKALEMQYIIIIIIMLLLFVFVVMWYSDLGSSASNIIDSFFR